MKKVAIVFLLISSLALIGCGSGDKVDLNTSKKVENEEINPFAKKDEILRTAKEVDDEYSTNRKNIVARKQIRKLEEDEVDKDDVIEYSKKSVLVAYTNEKSKISNKIRTVERLVMLDDLHHNTSDNVRVNVMLCLLELWEDGGFMETLTEDEGLELFYLTKYLDLALEENPLFSSADDIAHNMNLIIEDNLKGKTRKIEEYKSNIEPLVESVKKQLESF
ncbi:MAG: hypothetical protein ACRC6T_15975 [Sarcina sp.]